MNSGKHIYGVGMWVNRCLTHASVDVNERASAKNKYNTFYLDQTEFNKRHLVGI